MGNRYEGVYAEHVKPQWLFPHAAECEDQELLDDVPEGSQAVILGDPGGSALFIVGTVEELKQVAAQLAKLLEQEPPERPVLEGEDGPELGAVLPLEVGDWVCTIGYPRYVGRLVVADDDDGERLDAMDGQLDDPLLVQWPTGRQWIERDQLHRAPRPT